jgi:exosortase
MADRPKGAMDGTPGRDPAIPKAAGVTYPAVVIVAWTLALVGLAAAYSGTIETLWRVWMHNPNYSHGFLIPPIAVWLVWRQRAVLSTCPTTGCWAGVAILVPAVLLQIAGLRGDVAMLQGVSLVLALAGIVLQLHGWKALRRLAMPIAFLIFMIPALPWFMDVLSFRLKIQAARGAVGFAQLIGVAVQRDGVNLLFPGGILAVENACSGLRSLVALMALGTLFGYLAPGAIWKRVLLFLLALPIAVFANTVRIAALCVYAGLAGPTEAAGSFHKIGGYALFAIAFLLLALARRILRC